MNKAEIMTKKHDKKCPLAPRLRFPEFRDEWYSQALGTIASIIKEKAEDKKCTLMSIITGVGLISQIDKFGKEIAGNQYKNYRILRKGDFAYNKSATKDYPQGFIALYAGNEIAAVPNSIFTCFKVQPESIVPAYLNYLFLGNFHGKWLRRYITVGARAHGSLSIDDDDLLSLPIPYPKGVSSLGEQQKIADCLSSLDERIAAETSKLDRLKDHKKGLLKQLFPAEGETLPQLRFPEFRDAGEWVQKIISDVCSISTGKSNTQDKNDDGIFPFYVRSAIIERSTKYLYDEEAILTVGDGVGTGKVYHYVNGKYDLHQRVYRLFRFQNIDGKFLFYLFSTFFYDRVSKMSAKNSVDSVRMDMIAKMPISLPTLPEEQRIADCLSSLDELITAQTQKIDLLKDHKKGLMQQLFPRIDEVLHE
ncbi:restriction endonuclease subunit S [Desulfovibrio sp.]|uniref:restriction endonuclease subunit S n=1 Tax=Desulfovibrio sp. TaxID=885 RepID=UPI003FEEC0CE